MKVLVITAMWPTPANPAFGSFVHSQVHHLRRAGIDVDTLVLEGAHRKLIYPRGVLELRRRLAKDTVDLVHAHYGYVGWVARTQWKAPIVVTCHGDDVLGTVNTHGRTKILSRVAAGFGRRLGPFVDAVIVQSRQMESRFRGSNVYVIPHEVDFEIFRPTEKGEARRTLGLSEEKKYVLFAANPETPVKRFPLARAAADLLRIRDPSAELLVVFRETQPRLALYMSACDAIVFPSWQEGSPNVVKQAMACNLPIVATDAGDIREVIEGVPGCFICAPVVEEIAGRLGEILRSPVRTLGRDRVQRFAGPLVANRVIGVYENILRKRAKGFGATTETAE
jgi:teichuronic acid biosynthesis glycosyltransferase TuaC